MCTLTIPRPPVKPTAAELAAQFLRDRGYDEPTIRASRSDASAISPADAASVQRIIGQASAPDPSVAARNGRTALVFSLMYGRPVATGNAGETAAAEGYADRPDRMPAWLRTAYDAATTPAPRPDGPAPLTAAELVAIDARLGLMTRLADDYQARFGTPASPLPPAGGGDDYARLCSGFDFGQVDLLPPVSGGSPDPVDPWEREYDDPSQWPADTDAGTWEPTEPTEPDPSPEDHSWWAAETETEARIDRELDKLADEAAALARLCEGLSAPDPAPALTLAEALAAREVAYRRRDDAAHAFLDAEVHRLQVLDRQARRKAVGRAMAPITDRDRQRTGAL